MCIIKYLWKRSFELKIFQTIQLLPFLQHNPQKQIAGQCSKHIRKEDLLKVPVDRIRNFSIIAHVDHGKSTLADRLLEITGLVLKNSGKQILDNLQVEKARGITVKAQAVTLTYYFENELYLLNLIDTPGHVDFSNEVWRSLSVCDGVILLVDASRGIQAQTVANYNLAKGKNLTVIPVINKIDIKHANPAQVCTDMQSLFGISSNEILKISAKLGTGVESVLHNVIKYIPPPNVNRTATFRALIFDSWYDRYRGALNLIFVRDGNVSVDQEIQSSVTGKIYSIKTLSLLRPGEVNVSKLVAGQIGVIGCNMRNSKESIIGDTIHLKNHQVQSLEKFLPQKPMVFAGIYSADQSKQITLRNAIDKLIINDSAVTVSQENSPALGQGWRLGFLGLLHMEVFCQRLEQEFDAEPIITAPSVTYKIKLKNRKLIKQYDSDTLEISNASLLPEKCDIDECLEPLVLCTIVTPSVYVCSIIGLCVDHRGVLEKSVNVDNDLLLMMYILPLGEIMLDFNDKLKSVSSGYASFNYQDYGYHTTNIVKLDIKLNGRLIEELCRIVHVSKANAIAREMVLKLKEEIPRQMVQIAIQAYIDGKVIATETIKPYRKDVTAKLYGGDVTRRLKLLKQQAEGKKKMRLISKINVPHEVWRSLSVCDGVILLVDASRGIQAQTVANYNLAKGKNLTVIPVINKIDIKHANPAQVCTDMQSLFGISSNEILKISAKLGTGVESVLHNVIKYIPPPNVNRTATFRALIFDSWYDRYRGALNLIFVRDGNVSVDQEIQSSVTGKIYSIKTLSLLRPGEVNVSKLVAGQIGVIGCNMRNSKESIIGDTIHLKNHQVQSLEKFLPQKPMVFAGIYSADQSKQITLRNAIDKLIINDSAVTVSQENSPALGQGWRLGFLGLLHMEVFCQRLEQEFDAEPIITAPSVTYKIKLKNRKLIKQYDSDTLEISNASLLPEKCDIDECLEPLVLCTIVTPSVYVCSIIGLCVDHRGVLEKSVNVDNDLLLMMYILPLGEIMLDFNDKLKSVSSGYASFNYQDYGYHTTNIVKLDIKLNGRLIEELCRIVHVSKANAIAREMVLKLKEEIPRQMVQIAIQAYIDGKVIATETIKPYRKDVTAKLVWRSLSVCDGVILLVDASRGIQAQTVANYNLAKGKNLTVIPVINKIDIKHANPAQVCTDMQSLFGISSNEILKISAKLGTGVESVLHNVIKYIPPPNVNRTATFRALIFDSWYDRYRGALNLIFVRDGNVSVDQEIQSSVTGKIYSIKTLSLLRPGEVNVSKLVAGQIGVIGCNMRNSKESIIGDTIHLKNHQVQSLEKFLPQKPMVFAGIYSADQSKQITLRNAIDKLIINDSAVTVSQENSPALGQGWRLGFLGLLHMEVFCQRLEQEFDAEPIITAPSVTYKIKLKNRKLIKQYDSDTLEISNASLLPEKCDIDECLEPLVLCTIVTPSVYVCSIIGLCVDHRGVLEKSVNVDNDLLLMMYILPLGEIMLDFNDKLKSVSSGYASFNYQDYGYHTTNIVKLDIKLNGRLIEELCRIVHVSKANAIAREMVLKLKEEIPRQMVQIAIQAYIDGKVIATETIKPYRKDVTAKLYGGDVTRRLKLLKQQAEGKKKMRLISKINVPHEAFINVLKR